MWAYIRQQNTSNHNIGKKERLGRGTFFFFSFFRSVLLSSSLSRSFSFSFFFFFFLTFFFNFRDPGESWPLPSLSVVGSLFCSSVRQTQRHLHVIIFVHFCRTSPHYSSHYLKNYIWFMHKRFMQFSVIQMLFPLVVEIYQFLTSTVKNSITDLIHSENMNVWVTI